MWLGPVAVGSERTGLKMVDNPEFRKKIEFRKLLQQVSHLANYYAIAHL